MSVHRHTYDENKDWCCVYFLVTRQVDSPVHWIKIGHSKNPVDRALSILTCLPLPVMKFGYLKCLSVETAKKLECALHKTFVERKGLGGSEWFRFDWTRAEERAQLQDGILACAHLLGVSLYMHDVPPEDIIALGKARNAQRHKKAGDAWRKAHKDHAPPKSRRPTMKARRKWGGPSWPALPNAAHLAPPPPPKRRHKVPTIVGAIHGILSGSASPVPAAAILAKLQSAGFAFRSPRPMDTVASILSRDERFAKADGLGWKLA